MGGYVSAILELCNEKRITTPVIQVGWPDQFIDPAPSGEALRNNYGRTVEHVERAHGAFVRRRNAREALAKALAETQRRVELIHTVDFPMLPDVQEVLTRAEREFREGNYSGSSEDLQIATVLLAHASKPAGAERGS